MLSAKNIGELRFRYEIPVSKTPPSFQYALGRIDFARD
jgi:hypothetical protein